MWKIYKAFETLKGKGFAVDAIKPQAAIYLTVKIDLKGKSCDGKTLATQEDVTQFILGKAGLAIVPFHCFGADKESPWYRISVGTCSIEELDIVFAQLEQAMAQLS